MKIPKARKLPSGSWFIQLRLGGQSVPVTASTERACIRDATRIKADYMALRRLPDQEQPQEEVSPTLRTLADDYISSRDEALSPATVRGYRAIQKHRFKAAMDRPAVEITDEEWQELINTECTIVSPKTVTNAYGLIKTLYKHQLHRQLPETMRLPQVPPANTPFLMPEEILVFVPAIKETKVAVCALLALSSMRISEITALRWENIPKDPKFIRCSGAVVRGVNSTWVEKDQNKNTSSTRNVPILIPELTEVIERDRQPEGPVMACDQDTLRQHVHRTCLRLGITDVTIHGLRHSFASLAYHLKMPEKICMEIGGWSDPGTMHRIYVHIAQNDITRYQTEMAAFYENKGKQDEMDPDTKKLIKMLMQKLDH